MSLVAYGNGTAATETPEIANNGFWPAIDPDTFRSEHRVESTVTTPRVLTALRIAMASLNRQLADWQREQVEAGHTTADAVPLEDWQISGHHSLLYVRAVYAEAHAQLLERYREVSATQDGDERGEAKADAAEDYRRDARWAVAEIIGEPHTTVELI
ncbi:head completion/stabilization protein [Modicisalibacter sp. MOD 31.J]|uniref:head completion/stabilization protein n=1 Tax=Modicisalibacter sp. MOD 31.J TaxID=2831897 RepID=UPI001CCCE923|nr:head completion/stabilization protein [Modicisalibacter sp. MOD 31.J]MBZ9576718.1 head completion/stabilization protein [Modicisalibacter sp. MOD 31.J]